MTEDMIKKHMDTLGLTREEAIQLIAEDEAIDSGEKLFELTDEQKKNVRSATSTTSGKAKERKPKEKKVDEDKAHLIKMLEVPLFNFEHTIVNAEREISFTYNGAEYSLTLTKHRAKK